MSSQQDCDCGKLGEADETGEELVVARGDAAELFEFVEETFDPVALFVSDVVEWARVFAMAVRWDHGARICLGGGFEEAVGVVGLVSDQRAWGQTCDEVVSAGHVVFLAEPNNDAHRIAQAIGRGVDLGAQSAAGATEALGIRPPFLRRAPAAC